MASIIKVDTIQTAAGGTPTAADLGITVPSSSLPTGSVLQVKNNRLSSTIDLTATSLADVLSLSITPKSTSSQILALIHGGVYYKSTASEGVVLDLRTDSESGLTYSEYVLFQANGTNSWMIVTANVQTVHSPNTTSPVTYYVQARNTAGGITTNLRTGFGLTLIEFAG